MGGIAQGIAGVGRVELGHRADIPGPDRGDLLLLLAPDGEELAEMCIRDRAEALRYIREQNRYPAVVKADGLALGKGVLLCADYEEAKRAVHDIMEDRVCGASGSRGVVEEFLTGPEVSVLAFTDCKTVRPMVSSKDHKRAFDGDMGPNTGGMGTISPNPFYTEEQAAWCMEHIFLPTVAAMNAEGRPFKGCLYFGLMRCV